MLRNLASALSTLVAHQRNIGKIGLLDVRVGDALLVSGAARIHVRILDCGWRLAR